MANQNGIASVGGVVASPYPHQDAMEGQPVARVAALSMLEGVLGNGSIILEKEEGSYDPTFGEVVRDCPRLVRSPSE